MPSGAPRRERYAASPEQRRHDIIDFYELLEISPRASQDVIQAAYRALARNFHPDVNPSGDADRRIRELNAAYRVLSDPQDRAQYDLECLRARRVERLVPPDHVRARALPVRPDVSQQRFVEARFTVVHGVALLGLLLVLALAAILVITLAGADDGSATAYTPIYDRPTSYWPGADQR